MPTNRPYRVEFRINQYETETRLVMADTVDIDSGVIMLDDTDGSTVFATPTSRLTSIRQVPSDAVILRILRDGDTMVAFDADGDPHDIPLQEGELVLTMGDIERALGSGD
jgi:hypothetical protein